jgi:hypothetical protein
MVLRKKSSPDVDDDFRYNRECAEESAGTHADHVGDEHAAAIVTRPCYCTTATNARTVHILLEEKKCSFISRI